MILEAESFKDMPLKSKVSSTLIYVDIFRGTKIWRNVKTKRVFKVKKKFSKCKSKKV